MIVRYSEKKKVLFLEASYLVFTMEGKLIILLYKFIMKFESLHGKNLCTYKFLLMCKSIVKYTSHRNKSLTTFNSERCILIDQVLSLLFRDHQFKSHKH